MLTVGLSILQGNLVIKVILCHGQDHLILLRSFFRYIKEDVIVHWSAYSQVCLAMLYVKSRQ